MRACVATPPAGLSDTSNPMPMPVAHYTLSLLWHQRTAHDAAHRWVREQLLAAARAVDGHRRHR